MHYNVLLQRCVIGLFATCFFTLECQATANPFYRLKSEGWYWYETQGQKIKKAKEQPHFATAMEQIKHYQSQLEETRAVAVLNPTVDNVARYMKMQQWSFKQSGLFASSWQKALLYYPQLDETLKFPANATGRKVYLEQEIRKKEARVKQLAKQYGLFYFFKSDCPYCHEFASTVKHFAKNYKWSLVPISLDGLVIDDFPNAKQDNGLAALLNITAVPALFAVSPNQNRVIPITFGLVSEADLVERLNLLTDEENEYA